jgi:hypothetical protein
MAGAMTFVCLFVAGLQYLAFYRNIRWACLLLVPLVGIAGVWFLYIGLLGLYYGFVIEFTLVCFVGFLLIRCAIANFSWNRMIYEGGIRSVGIFQFSLKEFLGAIFAIVMVLGVAKYFANE